MKDPSDLQYKLDKFTSSEKYHYTYYNWLAHTHGVNFFIKEGSVGWLIEWVATFCKSLRKEHALMYIDIVFLKSMGSKFEFRVTKEDGTVLFSKQGNYGDNESLQPWVWRLALQNGILKLPQEVDKA